MVTRVLKRVVIGSPVRSEEAGHALLPKRLALPIFASDALSSVAYATQEILLVLALGGAAMVFATPWVALVVVGLLALVTLSYRQTCYAYPNGGGAYVVSRENLGESASQAAAAALLVDYVMTVAVSVTSGVVAVTSAIPLGLAGLAGLWSERAGVVNVGLEGMMILGTWGAGWAGSQYGVWAGVAVGIAMGAMGGLLHAVVTIMQGVAVLSVVIAYELVRRYGLVQQQRHVGQQDVSQPESVPV